MLVLEYCPIFIHSRPIKSYIFTDFILKSGSESIKKKLDAGFGDILNFKVLFSIIDLFKSETVVIVPLHSREDPSTGHH